VDKYSHGEPHIDRVDNNGKLVGRYNEDGKGIEHKGKTPSPIPNRDKKKFGEAADKLRRYKEQKAKAESKQEQQPQQSPQQKRLGLPNWDRCVGGCGISPYGVPGILGPVPGITAPMPQIAFPELLPIPCLILRSQT
jgi:hypothetical protein